WAVLGNQAVVADRDEKANAGNSGSSGNANNNASANTKPNNANNNAASNNKSSSYVVKSGDYLKKIADQYGLLWTDLAAANGISFPYYIHVGQTLTIPGG